MKEFFIIRTNCHCGRRVITARQLPVHWKQGPRCIGGHILNKDEFEIVATVKANSHDDALDIWIEDCDRKFLMAGNQS